MALNDNLQRVLSRYDDIANGKPAVSVANREPPVAPLMNVNHEDDEAEDDFVQLAHRYPFIWLFCFVCSILRFKGNDWSVILVKKVSWTPL